MTRRTRDERMALAFTQELHPAGGVTGSTLLALVPVFTLLVALAVLRVTAWLAVIIGSVVTILLALFVWDVPTGDTFRSYFYGTAIGAWAVAWIVFWGVVLYNTMVVTGSFDRLKAWLMHQATRDIRVQTILLAWAFGALLEGLVGFGYPWAVVAPILIALAAPAILIFLVSGRRGLRTGWPLAVAGSFGYIAGQYPIAEFVGPYLPDIVGSLTAFATVFLLIRFWRPREVLAFGGVPVEEREEPAIPGAPHEPVGPVAARLELGGAQRSGPGEGSSGSEVAPRRRRLPAREALYGL